MPVEIVEMERKKLNERFKKIAEIWFFGGLMEFSEHLEDGYLPYWSEHFKELWENFTIKKVRCLECCTVRTLELDFKKTLDINKYFDGFIAILCKKCGKFIDINRWVIVK